MLSHTVHCGCSIVLLAPFYVAGVLSCRILLDQAAHYLLCIVELVQAVAEERRLCKVLDVSLPTLQFVELDAKCVENASH